MARPFPIFAVLVATMSAVALALAVPATDVLAAGGNPHASSQSSAVGPGTQNDAGSGTDAGDTIDAALAIANAQRTWSANLTPAGSDSDWYVVDATSAFCSVTSTSTQSPGSLALTGLDSLAAAVRRPASPHEATRLTIAAPAGHSPRLGILPPSMTLTASQSGGGPPTPGHYGFSFATRTYGQLDPENDGESPEAGATIATAAALPADCAAGRIGSSDPSDRFTFDVADVRDMTFSFAVASGDAAELRILTPTGATFATIQSGGVADVWADQPGRWSAVVAYAATSPAVLALPQLGAFASAEGLSTSYVIGITDDPDPEPCRPSCIG